MKPKQFFETLTKDRLLPKEILALRKYLLAHAGKPCEVYACGCPSCKIWLAYIELESYLEKWEPKKPKKQWKPKNGEAYFCICTSGIVGKSEWRFDEFDIYRLKIGNVYPTEKLAEEAAQRILRAYKI